jgi:hypothetical protein
MNVSIVGLGYVGLPLAVLVSKKYKTYGIDLDKKKIALINNKQSPIKDPFLEKEMLSSNINAGRDFSVVSDSDIVIICYVRSNEKEGIGFVDNPNRINVAHTRCRREIVIIGDLEGLKRQSRNNIFDRMSRAFSRDGELVEVTEYMLKEISENIQSSLQK